MDERILHLEDGSTVTAIVNFATLYYMQRTKSLRRLKGKDLNKLSDTQKMQVTADLIYVLLRSNGKNVSWDEALILAPADLSEGSEFAEVFDEFQRKMEQYSKKVEAQQNMKNLVRSI